MTRVAVVLMVWMAAASARADLTSAPAEFFGPRYEPRSECRTDRGELGFADDDGVCLTGWDGTGEAPDAGDFGIPIGGAPPAPRPPPREVHVALPIELYVSLGLALLVGIGVIMQLARRRKPPD